MVANVLLLGLAGESRDRRDKVDRKPDLGIEHQLSNSESGAGTTYDACEACQQCKEYESYDAGFGVLSSVSGAIEHLLYALREAHLEVGRQLGEKPLRDGHWEKGDRSCSANSV